jgi:hypothetical protein
MDSFTLTLIGVLSVAFAGSIWLLIFRLLGGWPEAHYRFWGIPYFRQGIFEEDGTLNTWILKTDKIHHSVPSFKNSGGEWLIDSDNDARYHGRPSRYWNRGDSHQIPIRTWLGIKPVTVDEKNKEHSAWTPINPELLMSAYDDDSIERTRSLGRKLPLDPIYIIIICAIVLIVAGVAAYYAHDTFCALKPAQC